ncbi:MAG: DUF983 domain-containing protein [Alphaproteobacteria bacterium]
MAESTAPVTPTPLHRPRPGLFTAAGRALIGRCPNCGRGKLFRTYLKQVAHCEACSEQYSHIRSDDGAPWLTILIVGHIVVPLLLAVETRVTMPMWTSMTLWPTLALMLTFIVLPRAKGIFLSLIWSTRAPGSERD